MTQPNPNNPPPLHQELAGLLGQPVLEAQHFSELGNALRLVELHGEDFRRCGRQDQTFFWMGNRWVADVPGRMTKFAQDVVLSLYADATLLQAEAATSPDLSAEERKSLSKQAEDTAKWARRSENRTPINNMIGLALEQESVQIEPTVWDAAPMLINTPSGTLNLENGALQPHSRLDYITMMTVAAYDPNGGYQAWDDFLARIMPDEVLLAYLQRALGYSITGLTTEEKLFMPWGAPATGKSTLFRAVGSALGDYAAVVGAETFGEQKAEGSAPRSDVARLVGKRFILAMEVPGNQRLATSLLSKMTGGDVMVTRHMYREFFEFVSTGKIWITSNTRPVIPDNEPGMWRRVDQPPFLVQIPEAERDPGLKLALMDPEVAGQAVLRWLVEGCAQWRALGLATPQVVRQTSADYRQEMDRLADFLPEVCFEGEHATCTNSAIYAAYLVWCQANGERPLGRKGFTQRLEAKGFTRLNSHGTRTWQGIGLLVEGHHQAPLG